MAMAVVYATVNGRLVQESRGGAVTRYVSDTLGSCVQTRDSAGTLTSTAEYWPYGEVRTSTGSNPSPWGFVGLLGYLTDTVSRLYVRMRHYRPGLTRWQTVDPLRSRTATGKLLSRGLGIAPFLYCSNSPIIRVDRLGLKWFVQAPWWPIWPPEAPSIEIGGPTIPVDYHYGNYCGSDNPPRDGDSCPEAQNCIDRACQKHDRCPVDMGQDYIGAHNCHCQLARDAEMCLLGGCFSRVSGSGMKYVNNLFTCFEAAQDVSAFFSLICNITELLATERELLRARGKPRKWF
ncbi:MAG: hypothetical protein JSS65_03395 [Armatimonadetes bacterium]|nr:hypothetical protein [Armatimonadota bacterium]